MVRTGNRAILEQVTKCLLAPSPLTPPMTDLFFRRYFAGWLQYVTLERQKCCSKIQQQAVMIKNLEFRC